jgi:arylsulfatase A-like enzyme
LICSRTQHTARRSRLGLLACIAVAAALPATGCRWAGTAQGTVEAVRLVVGAPGTLATTYTLGDETRPVLSMPPETRLQLTLPSGLRETFTFPVPVSAGAGELIATGAYQRGKLVYPLPPQLLSVVTGAAGERAATLSLPTPARGPGPASTLAAILTAIPSDATVETRVDGIAVPVDAELRLAYALTDAAGIDGAAPVALEVSASDERGEQTLWSTVLRAEDLGARRWHETTIGLAALAGRHVTFVFRARAAGAGRPAVFPLWGDPTITRPGERPRACRNVVLISIDTLRADRVGVYGAYRPLTPAIDALAGESAVFTEVWAPWPETSGSHMSLFTSRYPSEHGVKSFINAPPASMELLAERLRREGYLTRAFTEDGGVWAYAGFARGFSAYSEHRSPDFVYRGEAATTFADASRWVETHSARTFFLFIHTYQVHAPYAPPRNYRTLFADMPGHEPNGQEGNALDYDREVRFTDDQVGAFLATLRRLGLSERTIVVLTSDHGEEFGEHGGTGHGRTLHREVLQVPLIVSAPGLLGAVRVASPASLLDVAPTILELLGLAADPEHRGVSMVATARATASRIDRPIFSEVDRVDRNESIRFVAVHDHRRSAITDLRDGSSRCYGADDPAEQRPGSDCPDLTALIEEHRRAVIPAGAPQTPPLDPHLIEKMRALGYVD